MHLIYPVLGDMREVTINSCISSFTGMLSTLSNLPVFAEQTYATINILLYQTRCEQMRARFFSAIAASFNAQLKGESVYT